MCILTVPHARTGVGTPGTYFLLNVKRSVPTPPAKGVGLVVPLSKTGCTFGLKGSTK